MPERVGEQANPFLALAAGLNPSNAYVADLFGTWTEFYEAKRSSATRRRDRTKLKRLGEIGEVRFVTPQDRGEIERSVDVLIEQKSRSFARMGVANMFDAAGLERVLRRGRDRRAHARSRPCQPARRRTRPGPRSISASCSATATIMCWRATTTARRRASGAGAAHLRELLRYSIEHGLKHFDFTIGDERYKREWSDRTIMLYDHVAAASAARLGRGGDGARPSAPEALHQAERGALVAVQPRARRDRSEVCGAGRRRRARPRPCKIAADRAAVSIGDLLRRHRLEALSPQSFRGASESREPEIHNHGCGVWRSWARDFARVLRMTEIERAHARIIVLARHNDLRGLPIFPSHKRGKRSADRRSGASAPVCERTSDVGPRVPAQGGFHRLRAGGRSPLGAPPRRFIGPEPAWATALRSVAHERCPLGLAWLRSHVPPVVAEGRCCRAPPGRLCACTDSRDAASRPALCDASRRHPRRTGRHDGATKIHAVKRMRARLFIAW